MPPVLQTALGQAQLQIGQAFGLDATEWTVSGTTGDGETTPVESAELGTVAPFYVRQLSAPTVTPLGTQYLGDTRWIGVGPLATADLVAVGTTLSAEGYAFQVLTMETIRGVVEVDLERVSVEL